MDKPNYYAIITAEVRYDKELPANAKLLFAEITALTDMNGFCKATNEHFAQLFGLSKRAISGLISRLVEKGYIQNVIEFKAGTKEIIGRYLTPIAKRATPIEKNCNTPMENFHRPMEEKCNTPMEKNCYIINTLTESNINTLTESNNIPPCIPPEEKKQKEGKKTLVAEEWEPKESTVEKLKERGLDPAYCVEQYKNACLAKGLKYINHDRALLSWTWDKEAKKKEVVQRAPTKSEIDAFLGRA